MCGRTACTLNPDQIARSTRYTNSNGKAMDPKWKNGDKDKYRPSYNKAPMSFCPVLMHSNHLQNKSNNSDSDDQDHERVITSMKWGLIPPWVKDPKQAQYKMNNARSDTMLSKASYKRPLEKGQRCVVLADGFYEWNTTKTEKQPYYIYFKDKDEAKLKTEIKQENDDKNFDTKETDVKVKSEIKTKNSSEPELEAETENNRMNRPILTMAGIFERRKPEQDGDEDDLYTFSVITVDSHPAFTWLHHRMPAMLENEDEVQKWLDYGNVPLKAAIDLIRPKDCLEWHPVSKLVNNSRNNSPECMVKIDLTKPDPQKLSSESKGMAKWLSVSAKKVEKESEENNDGNNGTSTFIKKEVGLSSENVSQIPTLSPKKEVSPAKGRSPLSKGHKSPKKGVKRPSSGSVNLMDSWLKKAKKD